MLKKIIAGSMLLATGAIAHAQSSVTMYGIIDTFIESANTGLHTTDLMGASGLYGSRWGMRGVEDLGGGLKAKFVLESGLNGNNGSLPDSTRAFNRMAYVALSEDGLGELRFGRQTSPMFFAEGQLDAFSGASIASGLNNLSDYTVRTDNTVSYISPNWNGFSTELYYGFSNTGTGTGGANSSYQGVLRYAKERLYLIAIYDAGRNATNTDTLRASYIGGHYDFDSFTPYLAFHTAKLASAHIDRDVISASLRWKISPNASASLGYSYLSDRTGLGNNAQQIGLLGQYYLSKATQLYGALAFLNNRDKATNTLIGAATAGVPLGYAGADARGVQLGIVHFF